MSRVKQADMRMSTSTNYSHELSIKWAIPQPSEAKPTWEIGFSYGILPLTMMKFAGTGVVYLDSERLWVQRADFDKAHGDLAAMLERGLNHALRELGVNAVKPVMALAERGRTARADHHKEAAYLELANRLPVESPERLELLRLAKVSPSLYPPFSEAPLPKVKPGGILDEAFIKKAIAYAASYVKKTFDAAGFPSGEMRAPNELLDEVDKILRGTRLKSQDEAALWLKGTHAPRGMPGAYSTLPDMVANKLRALGYPKKKAPDVKAEILSLYEEMNDEQKRVFLMLSKGYPRGYSKFIDYFNKLDPGQGDDAQRLQGILSNAQSMVRATPQYLQRIYETLDEEDLALLMGMPIR